MKAGGTTGAGATGAGVVATLGVAGREVGKSFGFRGNDRTGNGGTPGGNGGGGGGRFCANRGSAARIPARLARRNDNFLPGNVFIWAKSRRKLAHPGSPDEQKHWPLGLFEQREDLRRRFPLILAAEAENRIEPLPGRER